MDSFIPIAEYIIKVASRCNINCSYCYVYNLADNGWKQQPKLMSKDVAVQLATQIKEHCVANQLKKVQITFHGGEPLIGGIKHLRSLIEIFESVLLHAGIKIKIDIQTNLTLLTEEMVSFFKKHKVGLGISLDGPPHINDKYRIDHQKRPTGHRVEKCLELLCSEEYVSCFNGFLCVIDVESDPKEVYQYLLSYSPRTLDFLLPHHNHLSAPPKKSNFQSTEYGDWLIQIFDLWYEDSQKTSIRYFESIVRLLFDRHSLVESIGCTPPSLIVIETNGEVELVDTLKSTYANATKTEFNIFKNTFNDVAKDNAIRMRQLEVEGLCNTCRNCEIVEICGGGYLPHRYSVDNKFMNPSVYCHDIYKLIYHIQESVERTLNELKKQHFSQ